MERDVNRPRVTQMRESERMTEGSARASGRVESAGFAGRALDRRL